MEKKVVGKESEIDSKDDIEKEIKVNLNMITFCNFDEIKEKILDIASQK